MSETEMSPKSLQKIQLNEIRDYRGNLSFAEQDNPIPFDIKSVFWGELSNNHTFSSQSTIFLICLNGELKIEGNTSLILSKPCEACLIPNNEKIKLSSLSEKCILLLVQDDTINDKDKNKNHGNNILEMPTTKHLGLQGCFVNSNSTLPFDIKRVYFTYDIPSFAKRGGHAHIHTKEIVFPIQGELDVLLESSINKRSNVHLDEEKKGVFLDTAIWRELDNFKDNSLVLVLASEKYFEEDYIRKYKIFNTYTF